MYMLVTSGEELEARFVLHQEEKLLFFQEDRFFALGRYANDDLHKHADLKLTLVRLENSNPKPSCHVSLEFGTFRERSTVSLVFSKNHRVLKGHSLELLKTKALTDPSYPRNEGGTFLRVGDDLEMTWTISLKEPRFHHTKVCFGHTRSFYSQRRILFRIFPLLNLTLQKQESRLLRLPEVPLKEVISHLPAQFALETLPHVCQRFLVMTDEKIDWKASQKVEIVCKHPEDERPSTTLLYKSRLFSASSNLSVSSLTIQNSVAKDVKVITDLERSCSELVAVEIQKKDYFPILSLLRDCDWSKLTCLEIDGHDQYDRFKVLSRLREGIMGDDVFTGLHELTICSEMHSTFKLIPRVLYSKLKKLKFSMGGDEDDRLDTTGLEFFRLTPNLTHLDLVLLEPDTCVANFHVFMMDAVGNGLLHRLEVLGLKYCEDQDPGYSASYAARMESEHLLREATFPQMVGCKKLTIESAARISIPFKDLVDDKFPNLEDVSLGHNVRTILGRPENKGLGKTEYKIKTLKFAVPDMPCGQGFPFEAFKELEEIHMVFTKFKDIDDVLQTMARLADASLKKLQQLSLHLHRTLNGPDIFSAFCNFVVPRATWDLRSLSITGSYLFCAVGGSTQFRALFTRFRRLENLKFECSHISDAAGLAKIISDEAKSLKFLTIVCSFSYGSEERVALEEAFREWQETTGGHLEIKKFE